MSSIASSPLFVAGAIGLVGSALIEGARVLESTIGNDFIQHLPSQRLNVPIIAASAALVAIIVAKSCLVGRPKTEETTVANIKKKNVVVVGPGKSGKTIFINQLFRGLLVCQRPNLFTFSTAPRLNQFMTGDTAWNVLDTPDLNRFLDEGALDKAKILKEFGSEEKDIDAVIYLVTSESGMDEFEAIAEFDKIQSKNTKKFIVKSYSEGEDELEPLTQIKDRFFKGISEVIKDCKVLISGALEQGSAIKLGESFCLDTIANVCRFMADARETLVNTLIEDPEQKVRCLEALAADEEGQMSFVLKVREGEIKPFEEAKVIQSKEESGNNNNNN